MYSTNALYCLNIVVRCISAITVAPCLPGTASWSGLSPCKECKKGFYQPETGAQFCYKCDFGQTTHSIGSTRKQDCSKSILNFYCSSNSIHHIAHEVVPPS